MEVHHDHRSARPPDGVSRTYGDVVALDDVSLNAISAFTPSRQARELVIWAVDGGDLVWWAWVGVLVWTVVTFLAALVLFRRDEGRRYR